MDSIPSSKLGFLDLPGEIRNNIYQHLTPLNGHTSEFSGFFLACKQIYKEAVPEACAAFDKALTVIAKNWKTAFPMITVPSLRIKKPTALMDMKSLMVLIPKAVFTTGEFAKFRSLQTGSRFFPGPLNGFFNLHLSTLAFGVFGHSSCRGDTKNNPYYDMQVETFGVDLRWILYDHVDNTFTFDMQQSRLAPDAFEFHWGVLSGGGSSMVARLDSYDSPHWDLSVYDNTDQEIYGGYGQRMVRARWEMAAGSSSVVCPIKRSLKPGCNNFEDILDEESYQF